MFSLYLSNDRYNEYFSTSLCPDECLFQTLFMQTEYAGKQKGNLTYIDWSAGGSSPKTLTKEDFNKIINLDERYLFARKVDFNTDHNLVELLKKYIGFE